jgi:glycerol kinase
MAKNTYGTGCFLMMNTGREARPSPGGLLTTICCDGHGASAYALEGSVFVAGAAIQWLRDELRLIGSAAETESIAASVGDTRGVYVVPAFTGLGAPYWDMAARGAILGLTRGASRAHIVRATLESLAYQSRDVIDVMNAESGVPLSELRVDGGASANDFLMQFQADILGVSVDRPALVETTAAGAAFLAGLGVGYWTSPDELAGARRTDRVFQPRMSAADRERLYAGWRDAVTRVRS